MRVVPKEAKRRSHECSAEHRQFSNARDVLNLEIGSPTRVAADVGQHRERAGSDNRAADGQAVETVRQIDRIRRTDNHHTNKNQERKKRQGPQMRRIHQGMDDQVGVQTLEKRNHQLRRIGIMRNENEQRDTHDQADEHLKIDFLFRSEPKISLLRNFGIVVNEADDGKSDERKQRKQNKRIGQISPEQRGDGRRQNDQYAAHRWGARLFLMLLRAFLADVLPNLQFAQAPNEPRTKHQAEEHRRQARVDGANRDVSKNV